MNPFDAAILQALNAYARRWPDLDRAVSLVAFNDLCKGAVVCAVLWWIWFRKGPGAEADRRRGSLMATLVATCVALGVNRGLASALPHRTRPLQDPEWGFTAPVGVARHAFSDLSAFPSDHAVMFITLAVGVLLVSRVWGLLLVFHALVVVLLPRVYLGLHFPTDLLAGAALGLGFLWLFHRPALARRPVCVGLAWERRSPASFYALFFLLTYLMADLFDPAVQIATFLFRSTP